MQDKLNEMNDQVSRLDVNRRAEEKGDLSRDRMMQRKKERQAKEEADRVGAHFHDAHYAEGKGDDNDLPMAKRDRKDRASLGMDELTAKLHNARGAPRFDLMH